MTDSLHSSDTFDRFSLPRDIPGGAAHSSVPVQDWLARGLKHQAGRGWEPEAGGGAPRHAPPAALLPGGDEDPFAESRVFDLRQRVRFLDALASHGEVRAASACAGVSRETAYRARRRHADFAHLWDAALVHARARAEAELATRALDGVEQTIVRGGEVVGCVRRHDPRYLALHLTRLDRRIAEDRAAVARAECFDTLLAQMAGLEPPDGIEEAAQEARVNRPGAPPADVPATREEYVIHMRSQAQTRLDATWQGETDEELREPDPEGREEEAHAAMARAGRVAGEMWDVWQETGDEVVDAVVAGDDAYLDAVLGGGDMLPGAGGNWDDGERLDRDGGWGFGGDGDAEGDADGDGDCGPETVEPEASAMPGMSDSPPADPTPAEAAPEDALSADTPSRAPTQGQERVACVNTPTAPVGASGAGEGAARGVERAPSRLGQPRSRPPEASVKLL